MRRLSSVALLSAVLGMVVVTAVPSGATAAEGDPDDYCSHSPDRPLGWLFSEACRGHDECLAALINPDRDSRLACDDSFLDELLEAPNAFTGRACGESPLCRLIANVYHFVVRFVSLQFASVAPVALDAEGGAGEGPGEPSWARPRRS